MNTHSPGPWRVESVIDNLSGGNLYNIVDANGLCLAGAVRAGKSKNNARLMAAAPAMLEALLEQCRNCAEGKDYCLEHGCKAWAALKAAKGEQE